MIFIFLEIRDYFFTKYIMLVNLNNNNCYHKCVHIYWRIFLTNKLKSQFNAKIVNNGIVDIGQYKFAKQIGFCFDCS